jgi:hypothetical protein
MQITDFNVAAKSLVDLSHLQETVVWVVNQLQRHQDEIGYLQSKNDRDIPTINTQSMKQRHWMVERNYRYFYRLATQDGFSAFSKEWMRARVERSKWNKASWHAARMICRKAHAIWFDVWQEEKRNRHLCRYSLRNIRFHRLNRAMGLWQHAWLMARQDRQIIRSQDLHRAHATKVWCFAEFQRHTALMKRHKWAILTMTGRKDDRTKSKIMSAWKFLVDFNFIQEHKLWSHLMRKARMGIKDGFARWVNSVQYEKSTRGVVRRMHTYRSMRRLNAAMEDWAFAVTISKKARLLAQAEALDDAEGDSMEVARTMEAFVGGIVSKPKVRPFELQAAAAFLGRINDIKLHSAVTQVTRDLANKVDKPSAEDVARRARLPARNKDTFAKQLANNNKENSEPARPGSTMPTGPSAVKYTDTLQALKEANEKEEQVRQRLEERKQQALNKASEPVIDVPHVVYPPLGNAYFPQAEQVEREKAIAAEKAQEQAKIDAEVDKEMREGSLPGMPVSSTRKLLERQYRKEMKMKMSSDLTASENLYQQMYARENLPMNVPVPVPMTHPQMDAAMLETTDALARMEMDERTREALEHHRFVAAQNAAMLGMAPPLSGPFPPYLSTEEALRSVNPPLGHPPPPFDIPPPGSPGASALAQARENSMRLQSALSNEAKSGPGGPEQHPAADI